MLVVPAKKPAGVTFLHSSAEAKMSRAHVTGATIDAVGAISSARQRNTRFAIERKSSRNRKSGISPTRTTHNTADKIDLNRARSNHSEHRAHDYDRVIPYYPIKAGSSSSAMLGDTFTTLDMPSHIERLHIPFSVIGEFQAALQPTGKGKETIHGKRLCTIRMRDIH